MAKISLVLGRVETTTGAPRRLALLAKGLGSAGHESRIVCDSTGDYLAFCAQNSIPLVNMKFAKFRSAPGGALAVGARAVGLALAQNVRFFRYFLRDRPDVLIVRGSRNMIGAVLFTRLFSNVRVVWDIGYEPTSVGVVRGIHRVCYWMASLVICQYRGAAQDIGLTEFDKGRKVVAVFPAIDASSLGRRLPRPEWRSKTFTVKLLHIGTLCDRKNQIYSVQIVAELLRRLPNYVITLDLVGGEHDAGYVSTLRATISSLGLMHAVTIHGWSDDVAFYLERSDVLLLPSKNEGVSNTIQEAMSVGLPVISSHFGGAKEFIRQGESGFVLGLDDVSEWANCVEKLAMSEALYAKVSVGSFEYASSHFSQESWVQRYESAVGIGEGAGEA